MKARAFMASIIGEPAASVEGAGTIRSIGKPTAALASAKAAVRRRMRLPLYSRPCSSSARTYDATPSLTSRKGCA